MNFDLARAIAAVTRSPQVDGVRFCLDFKNGLCRFPSCRFWHIVPSEERKLRQDEIEINREIQAAHRVEKDLVEK